MTAMAMDRCLETDRWQLWPWIGVGNWLVTAITMDRCLETDRWQL